ncbi:MAG: tripartite tricarboxylate transporter TctB family protein [Syntrophus sp. (in: bacteria)]|nr:tripartite tricarboxylate transporter TctB family protein [Syntrophus sp. (in: bacteria)]
MGMMEMGRNPKFHPIFSLTSKGREGCMKSSLDIVPALVMIVLSLITAFGVSSLDYWSQYTPGPAFAPYWIAAAGLVLSILLLVQTKLSNSCEKPDWPGRSGTIRILMTSFGLVLILILSSYIGMITATLIFILYLLLGILRRKLVPSLITTLITVALIYGVFVGWLRVSLPKGPFGI